MNGGPAEAIRELLQADPRFAIVLGEILGPPPALAEKDAGYLW